MRFIRLAVSLLMVWAVPLLAQASFQALPLGYEDLSGNTISARGFGVTQSSLSQQQRWQWIYSASMFEHQGPMMIQELYLKSVGSASAVTLPSVTVKLGVSATSYQSPSNDFATNLGSGTTVYSGSWTAAPHASNSWVAVGIAGGFVYDPRAGDLLIEIERCGGTEGLSLSQHIGVGAGTQHPAIAAAQVGSIGSCTVSAGTINNSDTATVIAVDYLPLCGTTAQWQVNQAKARLRVGDGLSSSCGPIEHVQSTAQFSILSFESVLQGLPWDLGVTTAPARYVYSGAPVTSSGQIINIDYLATDFHLFNGGAFGVPLINGAASLNFPTALSLTAQMIVLDPGSVEGYALSALNELEVLTCPPSIVGPAANQVVTMPLCCVGPNAPAYFSVFGTRCSEIGVSSDGRVLLGNNLSGANRPGGVPDTAWWLRDHASIGITSNFTMGPGASIDLSAPAPNVVRVDFSGLLSSNPGPCLIPSPFGCSLYAPPISFGPHSFAVEINGATGELSIVNISLQGASNQFRIGFSGGRLGSADLGPTVFAVGGPNQGPGPRGMIYATDGVALIGAGINSIVFTPTATMNYDWTAY